MIEVPIEQRKQEEVFHLERRGFHCQCWYLCNTENSKGDAYIEIKKDGNLIRAFIYPAYKVFNIAAHFGEIIDSELAGDDDGYRLAGSTAFGGCIMPREIPDQPPDGGEKGKDNA